MILETSVHENEQIFKNSQDLAPALDTMNLLSKKLRRRRRRFMYKYCENSLISGTEICARVHTLKQLMIVAVAAAATATAANYRFHNIAHWIFNQKKRILKKKKKIHS
jgi:hypothetical protein